MAATNTRRQAMLVVAQWISSHVPPADILPQGETRAFVQDMAFTAVRRFRPLRMVLGELAPKWPKGELEALLLIGAAQILYMPEIPDFAAVNETVEAAKLCPQRSVAKVVNGVLRNLIRRRAEFETRLAAAPLAERESYPNILADRWVARYGVENAERLAKWHNEPAETWLAYPPGAPERFVRLPRGRRIVEVEGFAEGAFVVQDPATAIAVDLLDVRPGMTVLDFCAAPGGKTAQIAWRLGFCGVCPQEKGRLVAQEVNGRRRERLAENMARLRMDGKVEICAQAPDTVLFDRVLVDAPCSNTGVLRRRPDARWRWTPARLKELNALQTEILAKAAAKVAPGGVLVYSTCSNEPEENGEMVKAFLASHPGFTEEQCKESLPFETGHDGAFAAKLVLRPRS